MAQHKLTMVLAAETTQFSKKMSDVSKRIKSLNSDVQRFGKSFLSNMNLIKVKSASALVAAVKVQDAFKIIQAGTGATAEKLKGLQDEFKKLASSVPDSYQASATAIADLNTMLGLSGQSLQEMSKAMLDLTRLAGGDLKGNIAAVSQAMNSWGENSTSAVKVHPRVGGVLFAVASVRPSLGGPSPRRRGSVLRAIDGYSSQGSIPA